MYIWDVVCPSSLWRHQYSGNSYLHCVHSALYTALIICFGACLDCQTAVLDVAWCSAWWFLLVGFSIVAKETLEMLSCSQSFTFVNSSSSSPHQCDWAIYGSLMLRITGNYRKQIVIEVWKELYSFWYGCCAGFYTGRQLFTLCNRR